MDAEQVAEVWLALVAAAKKGDSEAYAFLSTFAPFARDLIQEQSH